MSEENNIEATATEAPAATPTTPKPLSIAATVPAQCVPCPFSSSHPLRDPVKSAERPASTFKSG